MESAPAEEPARHPADSSAAAARQPSFLCWRPRRTKPGRSSAPGQAPAAPESRQLGRKMGNQRARVPLLMEQAYEGDQNRAQAAPHPKKRKPAEPPQNSRLSFPEKGENLIAAIRLIDSPQQAPEAWKRLGSFS